MYRKEFRMLSFTTYFNFIEISPVTPSVNNYLLNKCETTLSENSINVANQYQLKFVFVSGKLIYPRRG